MISYNNYGTFVNPSMLRVYEGFPREGVKFIDIFAMLKQFDSLPLKFEGVDEHRLIFIPEARGFLFASSFPSQKVIPIRKSGKFPPSVYKFSADKEYGKSDFEIFKPHLLEALCDYIPNSEFIDVAIFDDVIATGSTVLGIKNFLESINLGDIYPHLDGTRFRVKTIYSYLTISDFAGWEKFPQSNFITQYCTQFYGPVRTL